jgi:hypothetical protein
VCGFCRCKSLVVHHKFKQLLGDDCSDQKPLSVSLRLRERPICETPVSSNWCEFLTEPLRHGGFECVDSAAASHWSFITNSSNCLMRADPIKNSSACLCALVRDWQAEMLTLSRARRPARVRWLAVRWYSCRLLRSVFRFAHQGYRLDKLRQHRASYGALR